MADLSDLAAAERLDLADYLDTLAADDWERPSLCAGWTVRDVAGHVPSYDELSWPALLTLFARSVTRGRSQRIGCSRRWISRLVPGRCRRRRTFAVSASSRRTSTGLMEQVPR